MSILIKRYPNRKLYNTATKNYISLEHLANLIRQGVEIQVVDNVSSEDLTALTLSQILIDQEKKSSGFIPIPLLAALVQSGGNALDTFKRFLMKAVDLDQYIDQEINCRIDFLVSQAKLTKTDAERIRTDLIQAGQLDTAGKKTIDRYINRYLDELGYATRQEYDQLAAEVEALSEKIACMVKD